MTDVEKFKSTIKNLILNKITKQEDFLWFLSYCYKTKRGKDPSVEELHLMASAFQMGIFDVGETIRKIVLDKESYKIDITIVKDKYSNTIDAYIY